MEMDPGPASIGIPNGMMPAFSFSAPSLVSSAVSFVGDRRAFSMSRPMSMRITPPAILKATSVIPNSLKIRLPANANPRRTMQQVIAAVFAVLLRSAASSPDVITRKVGMAASGSTRKKTDVNASSPNWSA